MLIDFLIGFEQMHESNLQKRKVYLKYVHEKEIRV